MTSRINVQCLRVILGLFQGKFFSMIGVGWLGFWIFTVKGLGFRVCRLVFPIKGVPISSHPEP